MNGEGKGKESMRGIEEVYDDREVCMSRGTEGTGMQVECKRRMDDDDRSIE